MQSRHADGAIVHAARSTWVRRERNATEGSDGSSTFVSSFAMIEMLEMNSFDMNSVTA
jgi:hypothetical protein